MSAVKRQSRLSLEELLHLRWLLGCALSLLSIGTMFYLDDFEYAVWPVAVGSIGIILTCGAFPRLVARVPRIIWRLVVPLLAAVFVFDWMVNDMVPAFIRLNALLVLLRTISYRSRREDMQLLALCLFLIVLTGVLTVSLVFAGQILVFTALAMAYMFVVNLIRDLEGGRDTPPQHWIDISRPRLVRRLWRAFDFRMLLLGSGLVVAVLAVSTLIFVAIPRLQFDGTLSFMRFKRGGTLTGFSESISLGEVTDIAKDNSIAMRVDVGDPDLLPTVPYWRMVALDAYDHGTFGVSRAVTANIGAVSRTQSEVVPEWITTQVRYHPEGQRFDFFLEAGVSRFLPLPGMFSQLRFKEPQEIVTNRVFLTYATVHPSPKLVSYRIEGVDPRGTVYDPVVEREPLPAPSRGGRLPGGASSEIVDPSYPETTLRVPVSPAARGYLAEIVAEISQGQTLDPRTFAQRACEWLAEHHRYSMSVSLDSSPTTASFEDPVIRWLQGGLPGHCEFFAAAFTLITRSAGFPTRAVTGFKGGTWNAYENYYMVRHSDAHAWCEVYGGDGFWFRVDPTPGAGGVETPSLETAVMLMAGDRSFSAYFDSLRMLWYRRIVSFDDTSQREVVAGVRGFADMVVLWSRATTDTLWTEFVHWVNSPWTFRNRGDLLFIAVLFLTAALIMRRYGVGTSDLFEWLRTGEKPTRRRAGQLLRRLELRIAEPKGRQWDAATAHALAEQLRRIRYGRIENWPATMRIFRAARRLL